MSLQSLRSIRHARFTTGHLVAPTVLHARSHRRYHSSRSTFLTRLPLSIRITRRIQPERLFLRDASNLSGPPMPGQVGPQIPSDGGDVSSVDFAAKGDAKSRSRYGETAHRMLESAATTAASILILGLAGYGYYRYYKWLVLHKMERSFHPGDPMLEISALDKQRVVQDDKEQWVWRPEQAKIDAIMRGETRGHYYLIIGEKGTGKSSMLLDAMSKVNGEGISMFEAHANLEIFRVRLGKALDFEFHEDYIGSLFSIKGPRDTTALLDIERGLNKLEKVAMKYRKRRGKPLVLIINSTHLIRRDEDGQDLLELIQQRAEQWAATNVITVVLNSDDYWVYERLKQLATRLEVVPVLDLPRSAAISALAAYRARYFAERPPTLLLEEVYNRLGGRLTFLSRAAKSSDMLEACEEICAREKQWLLNQCWILGEEMDDDVMDQQKYSSAAMVLAKALVDKEREQSIYHNELGHILPEIPLHEARQIMTRADFIESFDHINLFAIDSKAMVRADSVPMQNAFREICRMEGFDDHLEKTLERISAIESLGRTREVVAKDLIDKEYHVRVRSTATRDHAKAGAENGKKMSGSADVVVGMRDKAKEPTTLG